MRRGADVFFKRLAKEIEGDVLNDTYARGRYATDASIYQCFPAGIACPRSEADVAIIMEMAREEGLAIVPRGGGTSTAGQALGEGLVIDFSRYLNRILEIDVEGGIARVEPGVTLATLKKALKDQELIFPIDIASGGQATLGGMFANNTSGLRALRYGPIAEHVASAMTYLADGTRIFFREISENQSAGRDRLLDLLQFGELHEQTIRKLWIAPKRAQERPDGYNIQALMPSAFAQNPTRLLAGSEGTLALVTRLDLKLSRRPEHRALGVCRFSTLSGAIDAVAKIMALKPSAIELLDRAMLDGLHLRSGFDAQSARILRGDPEAVLLVEFDDENPVENSRLLKALNDCLPHRPGDPQPAFVEVMGRNAQSALWKLRRDALMSVLALKSAAQPIAFLEDAMIPLPRLGDYAARVEDLFARHGLKAMIHGHAGQGALTMRPLLKLEQAADRKLMHDLAAEMSELILRYRGSLTHGQGLGVLRSARAEKLMSEEAFQLFRNLKSLLDPGFMLNPGKILNAPRFDDENFLKAALAQNSKPAPTVLSWDSPSDERGGTAIEHASRCQGLSLCKEREPPFACPSYRVTGLDRDNPRGRATILRLAFSGQLGENALTSSSMEQSLRNCVSCKACKTTCPAGIDIARMKVETKAATRKEGRLSRAEVLYARLPEIADKARARRLFLRLRDWVPALGRMSERKLGLAADRPWPKWAGRPFKPQGLRKNAENLPKVAIFADTFNQSFEPANLRAAAHVLTAAGYQVVSFVDDRQDKKAKPLCCGRTYYDAGFIDEARREAKRLQTALTRYQDQGIPVIGLEPLCVLMAREEHAYLDTPAAQASSLMLFEEFLTKIAEQDAFQRHFKTIEADILIHSHCHERAHGLEAHAQKALSFIPGLTISHAPPTCCGLNGTMGLTPETFETSLAMAELSLFPAIRKIGRDAFIAATGYSCRKQIHDGLGQVARHPALILDLALRGDAEIMT